MSRRHLPGTLAAATLLALTAACQAPTDLIRTRPFSPSFRIQADRALAGGVEGRTAVPTAPGAVAPRQAGELTVRFSHLLGARQLMATVADVKSLTIQLSGNGVSHTETITQAMLTAGMTSFTFTGLPAGQLTVTIRALDAGGAVIGSDVQQATVTAGQTTVVASTVLIVPTVTQPRIIVTPSSGGSGGGATGGLTTTITLTDGASITTPALLGVHTTTGAPHAFRVAVDAQGNAWFTGGTQATRQLKRVTPADVASTINTGNRAAWDVTTSPDRGQIFWTPLYGSDAVQPYGFTPDGNPIAAWTVDEMSGGGPIAMAPDGTLLIAIDAGLEGYQGGQGIGLVGEFPIWGDWAGERNLDNTVAVLTGAAASDGDFVVSCALRRNDTTPHAAVIRYNRDGSWAYAFDVMVGFDTKYVGFDLDAQDNAWVASPDRRELLKVSPTGVLLATYPLPVRFNAVHIDPAGRIWAYQTTPSSAYPLNLGGDSGAPDDLVMRVGTDGKVQAYYHIGLGVDIEDLEVTADGHLWVASGTKGLLHLQLP